MVRKRSKSNNPEQKSNFAKNMMAEMGEDDPVKKLKLQNSKKSQPVKSNQKNQESKE
jgi:hypothetical protein